MRKALLIFLSLIAFSFGQVIDQEVSLGTGLSSDGKSITGKISHIVGADDFYSGVISVGESRGGFCGISVRFKNDGGSTQLFNINIRTWSEVTGESEWYQVAANIDVDTKVDISINANDYAWWTPAAAMLQIQIVSTGTGSVTPKVAITIL